jgi:short-subunit dehydrogenase
MLKLCFQELSTTLSSEQGKLYPIKCDIIREADIKDAFKWIKSNLGGVDILVNNAGVASENSLMGEQPQAFQSRNSEVRVYLLHTLHLIITCFRGSCGQLEKYTGTECFSAKCLHERSYSVHERAISG